MYHKWGWFLSHLFWLNKGRKKKVCYARATLLLLTSDFNYWPGEGGSATHFCTHTNIPAYTGTHAYKQWWVISGQAFTVHCHQRRGQRGVSWIIDELERGSQQIYSTRLTPWLSARVPDFPFCVWQCDCVRGTERRTASLRRHFLQHKWEGDWQRQR